MTLTASTTIERMVQGGFTVTLRQDNTSQRFICEAFTAHMKCGVAADGVTLNEAVIKACGEVRLICRSEQPQNAS